MGSNGTSRYTDFDALMARHQRLIRGLCWWHAGGDEERTSDLVQEVVMQLWHYRHKLRPDATPAQERHWVRFHCRSVFQHEERKPQLETVPLAEAAGVPADTEDHSDLINHLASGLDDRERQVLDLVLDDYTDGEIAELLHLKEREVRRLHRSMIEKMKRKANEYGRE